MKIPSVHSQFHVQWSYCPLSQYRNSFLEHPHHCCCCYCLVAKLCPALRTPRSIACQLLCPWDFPGKNTVVGCHFLLQGLFPTQRSNPHLLHWQALADGFFTTEPPLPYMPCANSPGMVRLEGYIQFKKWTSHIAIGTRSLWVVNEKQVWNQWDKS